MTETFYELMAGALVAVEVDFDAMTYSYRHPWTGERCTHPLSETSADRYRRELAERR